jgi:GNAT superfamily N-acetyltransferase
MKSDSSPVRQHAMRALTPADAPAAAALIRGAFAAAPVAAAPPPSALRETAEGVAAILAKGGGAAIEDAAGLAGVVLWEPRGEDLYMGRLAVRAECRGMGVARALIGAAESEARRRGAARLHLATRLVFTANRRLFAACGFYETTLHSHPGYDAPTFVDMEKPLG